MPKKKTPVRSPWTKDDIRQLKAYSKARTPVVEVAKAMKRTEAAVRQKAKTIEIGLDVTPVCHPAITRVLG
jgi:hypothetical protein